ncbi:2-hydroxychromene-2-carboxylate isomerase [Sinisalibacter aestuarii]|uniref:2-hydroxychromene-2-carboxylate isomerase n=1 Tax=Sinisalibacter aestuarii TaxID=2949426 RepID=A0ABQ5LTC0_9RHOB|nr:DsbA family protein [Sinisalibacter aestuarii]GKY88212.1 2-hydroxychromene-2-carboxylate isomerase [Sinisalibacter aestuarii]
MTEIDFWFSIGSTYSYLTVMRLDEVAAREGITFNWRPFNVREMMIAQDNIPFAKKPAKAAYMWRDIGRRLGKYGLTAQLPAPYPLEDLALANQVALVGMAEGWGKAYVIEAYRRWFQQGQMAGSEPNLSQSIAAVGQDPARVLARAEADDTVEALAEATQDAAAAGLFGVPSFVVAGELFWGDDRLDDAIAWARAGRLA